MRNGNLLLLTASLGALCVLVATGAGCGRSDKNDAASSVVAPPPKASVPKDHLAPAELVVGQDKAFALPLPRDLKVTYRFPTAVHAEGSVSGEAVANFFRARVQGGEVQVAARETRFVGVRVPAEPARYLQIRVTFDRLSGCRVLIEDTTPAPPTTGTPADRMRQVGLTPDGKLINPDKLE